MALALFGAACLTLAGGAVVRRAVVRHGSLRNAFRSVTDPQYTPPIYPSNSGEYNREGTMEDVARKIKDETDFFRSARWAFRKSGLFPSSYDQAKWESETSDLREPHVAKQRPYAADNIKLRDRPLREKPEDKEDEPKKEDEAVAEVDKVRAQASRFFSGGFETTMTLDEASMILGIALEDAADHKKLTAAHRRVMLRNHPDRGGSPFLATKINEAKDLLLNSTIDAAEIKQKKKAAAEEKEKSRSGKSFDVVEEELEDEEVEKAPSGDLGNTGYKSSRRPPRRPGR